MSGDKSWYDVAFEDAAPDTVFDRALLARAQMTKPLSAVISGSTVLHRGGITYHPGRVTYPAGPEERTARDFEPERAGAAELAMCVEEWSLPHVVPVEGREVVLLQSADDPHKLFCVYPLAGDSQDFIRVDVVAPKITDPHNRVVMTFSVRRSDGWTFRTEALMTHASGYEARTQAARYLLSFRPLLLDRFELDRAAQEGTQPPHYAVADALKRLREESGDPYAGTTSGCGASVGQRKWYVSIDPDKVTCRLKFLSADTELEALRVALRHLARREGGALPEDDVEARRGSAAEERVAAQIVTSNALLEPKYELTEAGEAAQAWLPRLARILELANAPHEVLRIEGAYTPSVTGDVVGTFTVATSRWVGTLLALTQVRAVRDVMRDLDQHARMTAASDTGRPPVFVITKDDLRSEENPTRAAETRVKHLLTSWRAAALGTVLPAMHHAGLIQVARRGKK